VATAGAIGLERRRRLRRRDGSRPSGLADGISERGEIVEARHGGVGLDIEADDLPAERGGEPVRMSVTEVVGVRLGVGGEGPDNSGGVRIDVRERRNRWSTARGLRAAS